MVVAVVTMVVMVLDFRCDWFGPFALAPPPPQLPHARTPSSLVSLFAAMAPESWERTNHPQRQDVSHAQKTNPSAIPSPVDISRAINRPLTKCSTNSQNVLLPKRFTRKTFCPSKTLFYSKGSFTPNTLFPQQSPQLALHLIIPPSRRPGASSGSRKMWNLRVCLYPWGRGWYCTRPSRRRLRISARRRDLGSRCPPEGECFLIFFLVFFVFCSSRVVFF